MEFRGKSYVHNQFRELAESDTDPLNPLFEWFRASTAGEYTRFYGEIVFHCDDGIFAAPADNLQNFRAI